MKKRYIIPILALLMLVLGSFGSLPGLSFLRFTAPVRPFIQLPGEVYPGTAKLPIIGPIFGGLTNTFMSAVVAWILLVVVAVRLRARSRTADEIPTGFYNFFEMIIEGAYNFAKGIADNRVKDFFPLFMTFLLYILVTNWLGLVPGWDSVGIWEYKPHFYAEKDIKTIESELETAHEAGETAFATYVAELETEYGIEIETEEGHLTETSEDKLLHEIEEEYEEENLGDLNRGLFLIRKNNAADVDEDTPIPEDDKGRQIGVHPEAADWTIVPFLRPGATDLNFTLAFALIAMTMVQYYGFKYLGARSYLSKFFPFIARGWGKQVADNPINAIFPIVGLLELVSEFSKIISFAFRLLGNLFAGMVLLFVMAFLLPIANIAFFGLELFVGLIQALVFALLMLIFMVSATESHHGDDHH